MSLTVNDMRRMNQNAGMCWFDKKTMKYWGSRVIGTTDVDGYFITSELNFNGTERRYTVRQFVYETADVNDVSEFQQFSSLREARRWLKEFKANK